MNVIVKYIRISEMRESERETLWVREREREDWGEGGGGHR